ncbi:MAG TPA: hypothetical protein VGK00_06140 [Anaerolineales bacterium]|jgi:general stress protein YciG
MKHTKQSAGQKGGRKTLENHGAEHFRQIGRKGAAVTWQRYRLDPVGTSDFALVDRQTGEVKAFLSGRSF